MMGKKLLIVFFSAIFAVPLSAYNYFAESGDYRIMISGKFKHTLRQIIWKDFEIARPSGYYGAIIAPRPGKFIGAGHTEGGEEKVLALQVFCDGQKISPRSKMVLKGEKITIEKLSLFDHLLFKIRLELTPAGLIESKRFIAVAEQKVHIFYAHIFCFNKSFTDYLALSDKGRIISGRFTLPKLKKIPKARKDQKKAWHVRSNVRYIAEYDAAAKKGVLLYYPEIIPGKFHKAAFWEVPYAYMKYYMMTDLPGTIPAGWESPVYAVALRCFEAENAAAMPQVVKAEANIAAKMQFPQLTGPQLPADHQ